MSLPPVVQQLLAHSGSSVSVEIGQALSGKTIAGGKYSLLHHRITLYLEGIQEQCKVLYGSLKPFEKHLAAVFAHELGHAEDKELTLLAGQFDQSIDPLEKKRIALRIETNAWVYARRLLNYEDGEFLMLLMHYSLEPYHSNRRSYD
ncbi:hypothetical protein BTO30_12060 [Domibacillus antri]|uniref:IrrE N-terminal-like domain-containing protein n=1 Tax=Domibacillus antri TaxID=1714264 RepID=A0A1Q8Q3S8_9BACI|nr:hypothetical protein BTO30_12060 [Domibacillus antri]